MINVMNALNAYTQNKTVAATPLDLIIMLYDGAIESLNKAATSITMKETQIKIKHINRAVAIIDELNRSLNFEAGGEIANNLQELYLYMMKELTLANLRNDIGKINHVESILKELVTAWRHIR